MKTMEKMTKNGKILRKACRLFWQTSRGVKMAAGTGYRTGYFMAKHPEIELAGKQIQKNYKAGLLAVAGIILGIMAFLMTKRS